MGAVGASAAPARTGHGSPAGRQEVSRPRRFLENHLPRGRLVRSLYATNASAFSRDFSYFIKIFFIPRAGRNEAVEIESRATPRRNGRGRGKSSQSQIKTYLCAFVPSFNLAPRSRRPVYYSRGSQLAPAKNGGRIRRQHIFASDSSAWNVILPNGL